MALTKLTGKEQEALTTVVEVRDLKFDLIKIVWTGPYSLLLLDEEYSLYYMQLGIEDIGLALQG